MGGHEGQLLFLLICSFFFLPFCFSLAFPDTLKTMCVCGGGVVLKTPFSTLLFKSKAWVFI